MSADSWLEHPDSPVRIKVSCWNCNRPLYDGEIPSERHSACIEHPELGLPIQIEVYSEGG